MDRGSATALLPAAVERRAERNVNNRGPSFRRVKKRKTASSDGEVSLENRWKIFCIVASNRRNFPTL